MLTARLGNAGSKSSLLLSDGRQIHLEEVGSVWYRRPTHITANTALPIIEKEFIEREARSGLWGLIRTIPGLWVNHPDAIREASYKARQLQVAHSLGLDIPRTLITNNPEALKQFHIECGGKIIYKLLGFPLYKADDLPISTYTNLVPDEMLNQAHRVTATAHMFQEYIEKVCDLRVIVIGQKVFAAEMYPLSEETRIDFRKDYGALRYAVHSLPDAIRTALLEMSRYYRLNYAAVDMLYTSACRYVYVETNPAGQFGWLEGPTDLPLYQSLARLLATRNEA